MILLTQEFVYKISTLGYDTANKKYSPAFWPLHHRHRSCKEMWSQTENRKKKENEKIKQEINILQGNILPCNTFINQYIKPL